MPIPPLVVSGDIVSATHINAIRNELVAIRTDMIIWNVDINGGAQTLSNVHIASLTQAWGGNVNGGANTLSNVNITSLTQSWGGDVDAVAHVLKNAAQVGIGGVPNANTGVDFAAGRVVQFQNTGGTQKFRVGVPRNDAVLRWMVNDPTNITDGAMQLTGGGALTIASNAIIGGQAIITGNVTLSSLLVATAKGHTLGVASGAFQTKAAANLLFHDSGINNWSGIGTDSSALLFLETITASGASGFLRLAPNGAAAMSGWSATSPFLVGAVGAEKYLWIDSSNRLRIKASAPASDTDGTVVGTQS